LRKKIRKGRKTKEETLLEKLAVAKKEFEALDVEATRQNTTLRNRIERLLGSIRMLNNRIEDLHTVIETLGKPLISAREVLTNDYELQATAIYSPAEKDM